MGDFWAESIRLASPATERFLCVLGLGESRLFIAHFFIMDILKTIKICKKEAFNFLALLQLFEKHYY